MIGVFDRFQRLFVNTWIKGFSCVSVCVCASLELNWVQVQITEFHYLEVKNKKTEGVLLLSGVDGIFLSLWFSLTSDSHFCLKRSLFSSLISPLSEMSHILNKKKNRAQT